MPRALQQSVLPYLGVTANACAWSGIGCVRPVSPAVEGERCSARVRYSRSSSRFSKMIASRSLARISKSPPPGRASRAAFPGPPRSGPAGWPPTGPPRYCRQAGGAAARTVGHADRRGLVQFSVRTGGVHQGGQRPLEARPLRESDQVPLQVRAALDEKSELLAHVLISYRDRIASCRCLATVNSSWRSWSRVRPRVLIAWQLGHSAIICSGWSGPPFARSWIWSTSRIE